MPIGENHDQERGCIGLSQSLFASQYVASAVIGGITYADYGLLWAAGYVLAFIVLTDILLTPFRKVIDANPRRTAFAKAMRQAMTEPERKLWKALRWRVPVEGTHFRRPVLLGPYIADFCSYGAKVVIEVDGDQHGTVEAGETRSARRSW